MSDKRSHCICYTSTIYYAILYYNNTLYRIKRKALRDIFFSHFLFNMFIRSWKFVIIVTRTCDIAHDENAMSSFIIQSI